MMKKIVSYISAFILLMGCTDEYENPLQVSPLLGDWTLTSLEITELKDDVATKRDFLTHQFQGDVGITYYGDGSYLQSDPFFADGSDRIRAYFAALWGQNLLGGIFHFQNEGAQVVLDDGVPQASVLEPLSGNFAAEELDVLTLGIDSLVYKNTYTDADETLGGGLENDFSYTTDYLAIDLGKQFGAYRGHTINYKSYQDGVYDGYRLGYYDGFARIGGNKTPSFVRTYLRSFEKGYQDEKDAVGRVLAGTSYQAGYDEGFSDGQTAGLKDANNNSYGIPDAVVLTYSNTRR